MSLEVRLRGESLDPRHVVGLVFIRRGFCLCMGGDGEKNGKHQSQGRPRNFRHSLFHRNLHSPIWSRVDLTWAESTVLGPRFISSARRVALGGKYYSRSGELSTNGGCHPPGELIEYGNFLAITAVWMGGRNMK